MRGCCTAVYSAVYSRHMMVGDCTAVYSRDCTGWSSQSVSQCTPVSDQSHTVQCPVRPEKYRQDIITILYHSELFSDNLQHRFR